MPTTERAAQQSTSAYSSRALLVAADLRYVRRDAASTASGATSHKLSNYVLTIQAAIQLVGARLAQGRVTDVDVLLDLAERHICESRVLITQARRNRFASRKPASVTCR